MFAREDPLKSADGVRDFLASYVGSHPNLDPASVNVCNFSLVPDLYSRYFAATSGPALPLKVALAGAALVPRYDLSKDLRKICTLMGCSLR